MLKIYKCHIHGEVEFYLRRNTNKRYCKICGREKAYRWKKSKKGRAHLNSPEVVARRRKYQKEYAKIRAPKFKIYQQNRWVRIKHELISNYGGQCECCGEEIERFLTVDHINNDGKEDRKIHGQAMTFYLWLIRNNYPKDNYRLLCYNCNLGRRLGICPHKQ